VAALGPAERRKIIQQGVRPDVRGVSLAVRDLGRQRDAPRQPRARDADVLQSLGDHVAHFVAPVFGLDELGVRLEVRQQGLVVLREAEEEIGLANPAWLLLVLGTSTLLVEVLLLLECLAALAVEALVFVLEQRRLAALGSASLVQAPEQLLDRQLVARI